MLAPTLRRAASRCLLLLAVVLLADCGVVRAARLDSAIELGRSEHIWSNSLHEERRIFCALPESYARTQRAYPVLYVLDPEVNFVSAVAVAQGLAHNGVIPEMVIIGVANVDRERDLTPELPYHLSNGQAMKGHAAEFLSFLVQELQPWVVAHYRATGHRTLMGHSSGGLFGLFTLMRAPASFDAYLLFSPAHGIAMVPEAAIAIRKLRSQEFVYLSSADHEPNIQPATQQLANAVGRSPRGACRWAYHHFSHENHRSSVMPALYEGLRSEFAGYFADEIPVSAQVNPSTLAAYYRELSQKLGLSLAVPAAAYDNAQRAAEESGRVKEQINMDEAWIADYPESGEAQLELGDALTAIGQPARAHAAYERGLELATGDEDPYGQLADYRRKVRDYSGAPQ